jgi:hypothetical protein
MAKWIRRLDAMRRPTGEIKRVSNEEAQIEVDKGLWQYIDKSTAKRILRSDAEPAKKTA